MVAMLHRTDTDAGRWPWLTAGRWIIIIGIAFVAPAWVHAAWLGFRNDLKIAVIMQELPAGQMIGGQVRRLFPGEQALDFLLQPVKLSITIVDGRNPNRVLYQDSIVVQKKGDQFYSLRQDPATGQVTLTRTTFPNRTPKR
jgi:hypothetical protein